MAELKPPYMESANSMAALYQIALNPPPKLHRAQWSEQFHDFVDFLLKKKASALSIGASTSFVLIFKLVDVHGQSNGGSPPRLQTNTSRDQFVIAYSWKFAAGRSRNLSK
ncbi:Serine/threonine-protein kinase TAO1 [Sparganum proliferum]